MKTAQFQFDLFNTTPYLDHLKKMTLFQFVILVVLFTWLPLVILSSFGSKSLLWDITTNVRFLFVLPLLMLTPYFIRESLWRIVNHFTESKIVTESEKDLFQSYIQTTLHWRDSGIVKILLWVIIYIGVFLVSQPPISTAALANNWFKFVSQPIYLFVQLYFIYRAILWWLFLFKVSRLDLQLKAAHGDEAGGLAFLGGSIRIFCLPIFALSASVSARAVNYILYEGGTLDELKIIVGILIGFFFLLFITPLFLFHPKLLQVKIRSCFSYGKLAHHQLQEFEQKWINRSLNRNVSLIDAPDFSAVIDSTSIVTNANTMQLLPFKPKALISFVLSIVLPFLPIVALKIPWVEILKQVFKLII